MDSKQQKIVASGLRSGDAEAWRDFHAEFAPRIWTFVARRLLGSASSQIADVVQETMFAAARDARNYRASRGTLWNWLLGIARNQVALFYRKESGRNVLRRAENEIIQSGGRLRQWLNESAHLPEAVLESKETALFVQHVLSRLPREYSELLTLKYLDLMTIEEIAQLIVASPAAVHSKLARARKSFRIEYQKQVNNSDDTESLIERESDG